MPNITRELLRKRAEHNEGMISTLEEISLHQEELESINEILGMSCRKLKILYLQNNIISKLENLVHLKDLEYLNLALNNIQKVEGLQNCEFLKKLDLTVNFIDFDTLEESIDNLTANKNLVDLYMMGNPSQVNWDKFNSYLIARLPQLRTLDGTEITRSMQITARQKLPALSAELKELAKKVAYEKSLLPKATVEPPKPIETVKSVDGVEVQDVQDDEVEDNGNEMTENTPEARVKIYKELAQQKKEKEDRANVNAPRKRDYEAEHAAAIALAREKEQQENGDIKQKNEGGWDFYWDEESKPGHVILEVKVAKFLDSSLIDVDVHPSYVSIVIKSKVLRLRLPAEVKSEESKCQRSKLAGSLLIIMPKLNPHENAVTIRGDVKARQSTATPVVKKSIATVAVGKNKTSTVTSAKPKKLSLQEQMLQDALAASTAAATNGSTVSSLLDCDIGQANKTNSSTVFHNIVKKKQQDDDDHMPFTDITNPCNRVVELD
eukprot:CAMPEP_0170128360 /NCGR_PEP_ID=MMETSP0020_2-20130122/21124_1 /TAXON_ID=98059 /ORGANISM="Dinobryon sp., Strain UTEXLB2267" /LENGTH=492 /DNA_ID=CAMNT_0010362265 /DNA_START=18 /DNA_END=1496 /DNA_ORIENTATION=-